MFDHLYKAESVREVGTIKFFRERLNRKNVTPEKVTKSFEGTEDFFISLGKAYLLKAAMEFFCMNDLNDTPVKHKPPNGILHLPKTRKKAYFDEVIGSFVDEFVMADPDRDAVMQNQELQQRSRQVATIDHDHDYFGALPSDEVEELEGNVDDEVAAEDLSGTDKVRSANFILCTIFLKNNNSHKVPVYIDFSYHNVPAHWPLLIKSCIMHVSKFRFWSNKSLLLLKVDIFDLSNHKTKRAIKIVTGYY